MCHALRLSDRGPPPRPSQDQVVAHDPTPVAVVARWTARLFNDPARSGTTASGHAGASSRQSWTAPSIALKAVPANVDLLRSGTDGRGEFTGEVVDSNGEKPGSDACTPVRVAVVAQDADRVRNQRPK